MVSTKILAQYEAVRRSGHCNMFDKNCVLAVAEEKDYFELASEIIAGGYPDILEAYERDAAEQAYGEFDFR